MDYSNKLEILKKESETNQKECWQMLAYGRTQHPNAVVIDATLNDFGKPCFTVYACKGDDVLTAVTNEALTRSDFRRSILADGGRKFFAPIEMSDNDGIDRALDMINDGVRGAWIAPIDMDAAATPCIH